MVVYRIRDRGIQDYVQHGVLTNSFLDTAESLGKRAALIFGHNTFTDVHKYPYVAM